jgi:hypothetical protein
MVVILGHSTYVVFNLIKGILYLCHMKIDKELRGKKGIYKILNTINNKCYIGSSIDLYNRGSTYKCLMKKGQLHNKHLQASFNKYGLENFQFIVLKICTSKITIKQLHNLEQKFINNINPEYNKRKIVDTNHLLTHSQETKNKISSSLKKAFKEGIKKSYRIQEHNISVSLFDLNGNHIRDFKGLSFCAEYLNVKYQSVKYTINSERRKIKNYHVLKTEEKHLINNFLNIPKKIPYCKRVEILSIDDNVILNFNSIKEAARYIKCKVDTLKIYYNNKKIWKKKYKVLLIH